MLGKEDIIKVDFTSNPMTFQLGSSAGSQNKAMQLDEALFETNDMTRPVFLKLHCDQVCFYDEHLNKTSEMEMIPKTNVWENTTQYYKPYTSGKEYVVLGMISTVSFSVTDQSNIPIELSSYSTCRLVLRITHF